MKPFKFFDHTADILYEATGRTFEEALQNAALALFETTADLGKVAAAKSVPIKEAAPTLNELATHVLSDLVAERDARGLFFKSFKVEKFAKTSKGFELEGIAKGSPMQAEAGKLDVKAVTHHQTRVTEAKGKWTIRVLLDI